MESDGNVSVFDSTSKCHVQGAVQDFYDRRAAGDDGHWLQWLSNTDPSNCRLVKKAYASHLTEEIRSRSCGCGSPFPELLEGARVLDLGCGIGGDCMVLSQLVGSNGKVVGVDLCPALVADAHENARIAGLGNVEFVHCDAEEMAAHDRVSASGPYDVIVANCSLCQVRECSRVEMLKTVQSLLRPGGELYICDLFVSVDVSDCVRKSPKAWCMGLGGAWTWPAFCEDMKSAGFTSPLRVSSRVLEMSNDLRHELAADMGVNGVPAEQLVALEEASGFQVCSGTYRLFKPVVDNEDGVSDQSNHGARVDSARITYTPPSEDSSAVVHLTKKISCYRGQSLVVVKEIADILRSSRLSRFFTISPVQSLVRLPQEKMEPFILPPPVIPPVTTGPGEGPTGIARPPTAFTLPNGGANPSKGSDAAAPLPNLAHILQSTAKLQGLYDLVKNSKNGGCSSGGC